MFYPLNYEAVTGYSIATKNRSVNVLNILLLGIVILGLIGLFFYMARAFQKLREEQKSDQTVQVINQNIQAMHERLDKAAHYMGAVGQELRTMQEIGKNVSDLRLALTSSKLRGNFGERILQDMLENFFPNELYALQHKFRDGQAVDAIIKTKDGFIPVDSKFPIDNFRKMIAATTDQERVFERNEFFKAVRKHLSDIARKYILPGEGTTDFAVMYVPSEAVYYEIISSNDELPAFAESHKVLMASPNTMAYFLHILRMGQERTRIEENVQRVWEQLSGLTQETGKFGEALSVAARHITNAKNAMDGVTTDYGKLAIRVENLKQLK